MSRTALAALGLKPAGENGGWFQTLPLKEVRMDKARDTASKS